VSIDIRLGPWQERLRDVPDGSVRLILTSPPYDNARTYEGTQTEPVDFDELGAFCRRVLMPGGTLAMVLDAPMRDGRQSITPYRVICEWAAMPGWKFRQFLAYGRGGVPGNTAGWFRRDHEPLLVFVRDGGEQVCEKDRMATRAVSVAGTRTKRAADGSMVKSVSPGSADSLVCHRGSVWWYGATGHGVDASASTGHPATFAERFATDAVQVWSNPGDIVCDPYSGSGTVAKVCRDLDRSFVGAERVKLYHEMSLRRLDPTYISEERAADVDALGPLFGARHA
jgi:site-specific DNA-methyltransferase (adenine-specific)